MSNIEIDVPSRYSSSGGNLRLTLQPGSREVSWFATDHYDHKTPSSQTAGYHRGGECFGAFDINDLIRALRILEAAK